GLATKAISAGSLSSIVLKNDGTVWGWGYNQFGESGDSPSTSLTRTNPVAFSTATNVIAIAGGGFNDANGYFSHTLMLKNDGVVLACGNNTSGQLGDGTTSNRTTPVAVTNLSNAVALAAGQYHSIVLKADGT